MWCPFLVYIRLSELFVRANRFHRPCNECSGCIALARLRLAPLVYGPGIVNTFIINSPLLRYSSLKVFRRFVESSLTCTR